MSDLVTCQVEHVLVPVSIGRTFLPGRWQDDYDPFETSIVLPWYDEHTSEVCAVDKPLTREEMKAIRLALAEHGCRILKSNRYGKRTKDRRLPDVPQTKPTHPLLK